MGEGDASEDCDYLIERGWYETELGWFSPRDVPLKMCQGWTLSDALTIERDLENLQKHRETIEHWHDESDATRGIGIRGASIPVGESGG